jgi:hypothetical protein
MHFSKEPTHHSRVNYGKVGQEQAVDDFVHEMLENGNIELAPKDAKLYFALLVVDKRDDLGEQRLCRSQGSYQRFEMKQRIVCFKWRGKMYVWLRLLELEFETQPSNHEDPDRMGC